MQVRNMKDCLNDIQGLASIAFAMEFRGTKIGQDIAQQLKNNVSGLLKEAMSAIIQAKQNNAGLLDYIPAGKAADFARIADEYNVLGYTAKRLEREADLRLKELYLARSITGKDPQAISEAWQAYQAAIADFDKHGVVNGVFSADEISESIHDLYNSGLQKGLKTGWKSLDALYSVRECEMTIVTGIPGSGKSTWLDALAVNLHQKHGWKIAFCSPENWPISRHAAGLIEKIVGKPFNDDPFEQRMTKSEMQKGIDTVSKAFYFTQLQDENMNIGNILKIMREVIEKNEVNGIVLDPWNELEHHRPTDKTETEFISESLGQIRRFARFNKVHVWVVAHPKKLNKQEDNTYPVPRLYDIAGSAAFYNKADNGICVHRSSRLENTNVDIYVQKIRFKEVGKLGKATLNFIKSSGRYFDQSSPF